MAVKFHPLFRTLHERTVDLKEPWVPETHKRAIVAWLKANRKSAFKRYTKAGPAERLYLLYKHGEQAFKHDKKKIWRGHKDESIIERLENEAQWIELRRPYYNVWPKVLTSFLKLKLDNIKPEMVQWPEYRPLALKLPIGNPLQARGVEVKSIFVCLYTFPDDSGVLGNTDAFSQLQMEYLTANDTPEKNVGNYISLSLHHGQSIEEALERLAVSADEMTSDRDYNELREVARLAIGVSMIKRDADWLIPVLPDLTPEQLEKLMSSPKQLDALREREGTGYDVGKETGEVQPHWRNAHPHTVRYGPGKMYARVDLFKPILVNRKKLLDVPSGHAGGVEDPRDPPPEGDEDEA